MAFQHSLEFQGGSVARWLGGSVAHEWRLLQGAQGFQPAHPSFRGFAFFSRGVEWIMNDSRVEKEECSIKEYRIGSIQQHNTVIVIRYVVFTSYQRTWYRTTHRLTESFDLSSTGKYSADDTRYTIHSLRYTPYTYFYSSFYTPIRIRQPRLIYSIVIQYITIHINTHRFFSFLLAAVHWNACEVFVTQHGRPCVCTQERIYYGTPQDFFIFINRRHENYRISKAKSPGGRKWK